jgi:hypothetical protein
LLTPGVGVVLTYALKMYRQMTARSADMRASRPDRSQTNEAAR